MELAIYSFSPTGYLIVDNINLLEFLLKLIVVAALLSNLLLGGQDVFILELGIGVFLGSCSIGLGVDLEVMKSVSEHLVVFLQNVHLLVAVVDVL